jgi:hypothetical protein
MTLTAPAFEMLELPDVMSSNGTLIAKSSLPFLLKSPATSTNPKLSPASEASAMFPMILEW